MERFVTFNPDVTGWDYDFLNGVWRKRLNLWSSMRAQMGLCDPSCEMRTVSPGKAIIRFTSISLGLIGELMKHESVRGK